MMHIDSFTMWDNSLSRTLQASPMGVALSEVSLYMERERERECVCACVRACVCVCVCMCVYLIILFADASRYFPTKFSTLLKVFCRVIISHICTK